MPHECEAQAGTLDVVNQRIPAAVEFLEDFLLFVGWDADAMVPDFQITRPFARYKLTPIYFWSLEYFSALLTRLRSERASASRSTTRGGISQEIFSSKAKPFCWIWNR